jgi:hypothetical protein
MTHPFQSLIGPVSIDGLTAGAYDHNGNGHAEGIAQAVQVDAQAPISIPPTQTQDTGKQPASSLLLPRVWRSPLTGGQYSPEDALKVLNEHFFIGKSPQETAIFRINLDGTVAFLPPEQFKLEVQNVFVGVRTPTGATKWVPADKFWKEHPKRNQKRLVFKPGGTTDISEYNLWRGYGVEPHKGWQKQRRLLRHVREVICRRDKAKFKYLIRSLAWMVQNPDKHSGVVIMLKSRKQGTGKTTLGNVMLDIFGEHGARIDDKDRLLGRFTDWLETVSFVLAEEILFAGDPKSADKLKSLVTGDTIQVERKFGSCRQVPNRLKIIATTNHDHAVAAGVQDRRNVVFDVSDERVADKAWFDALYRDLDDGGTSEFLWFLQSVRLGNWHPSRDILKTAETAEQQRMSGDSVAQWSQACIEADAVIGAGRGSYGTDVTHDLGIVIASDALREAYTGFCKQNGLRPLSTDGFGKACAEMFGPRKRLSAKPSPTGGKASRRPWGYHVPKGNKWQQCVDARLGIKP